LIERYILDELKSLRSDYLSLQAEIARKLAQTRLDISDRALRYSADTMNNIFIAITISASILVLVGLNSLRDIKMKTEDMVNSRIEEITQEYRKRLYDVEDALRRRTEEIIAAQEDIAKTNEVHSLWMRVGLENNIQQKIEIYDEILKINRDDAEAYAYKADAVLELGESEWAINLCNKAIEVDPDYGYAYWQLACAHAVVGNQQYAIDNLKTALEKSPQLAKDIETESSFASLRELESYKELVEAG
jgi:tetratricopeptide (TPR) repeat protein